MSSPTHVYVDLQIINNDQNPSSPAPQLSFSENRSKSFLDGNSEDYYLTISRFSIQTGSSLPVFIPSILSGQYDPNQTVYNITFSSKTHQEDHVLPIIYVPSNYNVPTPGPPNEKQDLSTSYYYVKNYQDFIAMVNKTLDDLYRDTGITGPTTKMPPYIEFDPEKYTCILNVPQYIFADYWSIYFNIRLMQLFTGMPAIFETYNGDKNYKINISNNTNNIINKSITFQGAITQNPYIQIYQEFSSVSLWNPVSSIVFTSNSLPVYPTQSTSPKVITNQTNGMISAGTPNITNILTGFEIPITSQNQYRPEINYIPSGEYRLIDLLSTNNLNKIDLNVWWMDKFGNLNPFYLQAGCSANIKILFRNKRYFLGQS